MCKHIYNPDQIYQKGTPFTYLISWSELNISYYGVRYKKTCHPDDLWNIYFTSSTPLKKFRKLNGEPDIIKIDFVYDTKEEAISSEYHYIKKNNLVQDSNWLNIGNGGEEFCNLGGYKHSEKSKKKMSDAKKGRPSIGAPCSEERKQKISDFQKGKPKSAETKQKIADTLRGKPKSAEAIKNSANARKGLIVTKATKKKIGDSKRGKRHSEERKLQNSESHKGKICVNNGIFNKMTTLEDAENIYYPQGFIKGKIKKLL